VIITSHDYCRHRAVGKAPGREIFDSRIRFAWTDHAAFVLDVKVIIFLQTKENLSPPWTHRRTRSYESAWCRRSTRRGALARGVGRTTNAETAFKSSMYGTVGRRAAAETVAERIIFDISQSVMCHERSSLLLLPCIIAQKWHLDRESLPRAARAMPCLFQRNKLLSCKMYTIFFVSNLHLPRHLSISTCACLARDKLPQESHFFSFHTALSLFPMCVSIKQR
jgi:hypothetical protein